MVHPIAVCLAIICGECFIGNDSWTQESEWIKNGCCYSQNLPFCASCIICRWYMGGVVTNLHWSVVGFQSNPSVDTPLSLASDNV